MHAGQVRITNEAKRFNVAVMGRRWGKSTYCRDRIINCALKGYPTAWFAPVNKILADSWREMKMSLLPITTEKSEDEHRIEILGGGSVEMWSLESADAGRSRKYALVVVDEAAMVANLETYWQENILPTLTDYTGGAWFASTPKGMNFFKTLYDRGLDPTRPEWKSWQLPSSTNPHLPPEAIEASRAEMTEATFNQEYLALFVNWEGSVFRNVMECATSDPADGPESGHEYVIGVDWGRSRDYTVFTVIDKTAKRVVSVNRSNKVDYSLQRGRLASLKAIWNPIQIIAESNSIGQPIIEQLERDGISIRSFQTTNTSKNQIIEHLALAFERMDIQILNDPILVSELVAFQGKQLPSGVIKYEAASGHDDCVMSLAIGWSEVAAGVSYGLLDMVKAQVMGKLATSEAIKVALADNSNHCPQCESKAISRAFGNFRCNQCGHEFGGVGSQAALTRNDLAKIGGGRGWVGGYVS